jgi:hypothetical protein
MSLTPRSARRILLSVGVVAALAVPAAASAHYGPPPPPKDYAFGLGDNNPPNGNIAHFGFSAVSDADGSNANGLAAFAMPDPTLGFTFNAGVVQCLRVSGNVATLVFKVKWSRKPAGDMTDADRMYIQDNGVPSDPHHPVDKVVNQLFNSSKSPTGLDCPDPTAQSTIDLLNSRDVITKGDVTVIDN